MGLLFGTSAHDIIVWIIRTDLWKFLYIVIKERLYQMYNYVLGYLIIVQNNIRNGFRHFYEKCQQFFHYVNHTISVILYKFCK